MDSSFWEDLFVVPEDANKLIKKHPKTIYRFLAVGDSIPKPTEDFLREKSDSTAKGIELIAFLKDRESKLLKTMLLLKNFSNKKNTKFIFNFAQEKLGRANLDQTLRKSSHDRLAILALLYFDNSHNLRELYWRYEIERKMFNEYEPSIENIEFYESIPKEIKKFELMLEEFRKSKDKNCHCWEILKENEKTIYCIRGFPSAVINPGVQNNEVVERAPTMIIKLDPNQKIFASSGSKRISLKLFNYLLKKLNNQAKFERVVKKNKTLALKRILDIIIKRKSPVGINITQIKVRNVSQIDDQPTLVIEKDTGIESALLSLKEKGIDLEIDAEKISSISINAKGKQLDFVVEYIDGYAIILCKTRFFSDELRNEINKFFNELGLEVTLGSDRI